MKKQQLFKIGLPLFLLVIAFSLGVLAVSDIQETSFSYTASSLGGVKASIGLKNFGDTASDPFLVEMQIRSGKCSDITNQPFSFVGSQSACNNQYPTYVHRPMSLYSGATANFVLSTNGVLPAGDYCLVMVSADSCCNSNPSCQKTSLYGWGSKYLDIVMGESFFEQVISCGNGRCESGETAINCAGDCQTTVTPGMCGNGVCDSGESVDNCRTDCPITPESSVCGDGVCNLASESSSNCAKDCTARSVPVIVPIVTPPLVSKFPVWVIYVVGGLIAFWLLRKAFK